MCAVAILILLLLNPIVAYHHSIIVTYLLNNNRRTTSVLAGPVHESIDQRRGVHSAIRLYAAAKASDSSKIRVRLLNDNKELGKKGDIIMVSKALWTNVLQPKKGAEVITDAELLRIETEAREASLKAIADAKEAIAQIIALEKISLKRKIGKNNKLFGTVTVKNILDELKLNVPPHTAEVLSGRQIAMLKLVDTTDPSVDFSKAGEIRQGGQFRASLQVHPTLEYASFLLDILPE